MPLPPAAARKHLHTRQVHCEGFLREDGLWDIEASIIDTKRYAFGNEWRGTIEPGDPLHEMRIRLTVDDDFVVQAVAATVDNSPFAICPGAAPNFERLKGLRIGAGWNRAVRQALGGATEGCTHMVELLGPMATVAFQTIRPYQRHLQRQQTPEGAPDPTKNRPAQLNTCYAYADHRDVVRRWMPAFYTGTDGD